MCLLEIFSSQEGLFTNVYNCEETNKLSPLNIFEILTVFIVGMKFKKVRVLI